MKELLIRDISIAPGADFSDERRLLCQVLNVPKNTFASVRLVRRAVDARKRSAVHWCCSFAVKAEPGLLKKLRIKTESYEPVIYEWPKPVSSGGSTVVVGAGPGGLFAALALARAGQPAVLLEQGEPVEKRRETVERFMRDGKLNPLSNVQFGEGGAGTFSDGKLTTGVHDPACRAVIETFAEHGAGQAILIDAKPHIGTDVLSNVIASIRRELLELGTEIHFGTKLVGINVDGEPENMHITGCRAVCEGSELSFNCDNIILAIGHSSRETFRMLHACGVPMMPKPFAIGARIEHLRQDIDRAQYGEAAELLPAADYKLSVRLPDGRGVYTFCMCPGGRVINASSEEGRVVVNGMSFSARDEVNSNSALLVGIGPEDFGEGVFDGMELQEQIERRCYEVSGGYRPVAQSLGDFMASEPSVCCGEVEPSVKPGVRYGSLDAVLPGYVTAAMREAIPQLGRRLRGFDSPGAILTGPETRSSSPVRIIRGKNYQSAVRGLYPCGEGAGYAGGIVSAAADGLHCAAAVLGNLNDNGL